MRFLTYRGLETHGLDAQLARLADAVERDDLRSPDFKKLEGHPYHRAKLSDAARAICQLVEHRGQRACLVLEVLPHHDYGRSRFLRGAVIDEAKILSAPEEPVAPVEIRYLHPERPTFHLLDKPLSFDDAQEAVLARRPPVVLVGSAGSGKTAVALELLRAQPGQVAYVTESPWLAQHARTLYFSHQWDPGEQEAGFFSFAQLVESVRVPDGRPATFQDFVPFFERHRHRARFTDAHAVFEELRGVLTADPAGPLALEPYLALGVKQSMFSRDERPAIHALFTPWLQFLREKGLFEPNLAAGERLALATPRFDFVTVDEVQDLTPVQLALVLACLKPEGSFLVAGDAHQVVHPNFFSWSQVKSMFWRGQLADAAQVSFLDVSYRTGTAVTELANRLLCLKHHRFGSIDRESNTLLRPAGDAPGTVQGLAEDSPPFLALAGQVRRSASTAVIVLDESHKARARARYGTPLVFSVLEAKGLEYDTILLDGFVAARPDVFRELAQGVDPAAVERTELVYARAKDKADRSLDAYKFFLNALHVGITRAVRRLIIVEPAAAHPLWPLLKVAFDGAAQPVTLAVSSVEDWQREAGRLEQHGKLEQAQAIRSSVLRERPVPWTVLDEAGVLALAHKALEPRSVSRKAKEQLHDYASYVQDLTLVARLARVHPPAAQSAEVHAPRVARRILEPYEARKPRQVLDLVDQHGPNHRNVYNSTPLMLAATAGNVGLCELLLERGADPHLVDHLGLTAAHWAIRRALPDRAFATARLGPVFDVVAPPAIDVQVNQRLVQVGRQSGEYVLWLAMTSSFSFLFTVHGRFEGFSASLLFESSFPDWPDVVSPARRRARQYVNHVLARSEVNSSYPSSRQLWIRERQGHYLPNLHALVRVKQPDGASSWTPVGQLVNIPLLVKERTVGLEGAAVADARAG